MQITHTCCTALIMLMQHTCSSSSSSSSACSSVREKCTILSFMQRNDNGWRWWWCCGCGWCEWCCSVVDVRIQLNSKSISVSLLVLQQDSQWGHIIVAVSMMHYNRWRAPIPITIIKGIILVQFSTFCTYTARRI